MSEHVDFSPSYSPSGNKIVFVRAFLHPSVRQIFKMDSVASNRVQLTASNFVPSEHPTWSPDGNRIAFERFVNGSLSLYSIEPDGSSELQLTFDEDSHDREPSYSPSGNKIVYGGQNDVGDSGLFVIPALGGPRERLTDPRPSGVDAEPLLGADAVASVGPDVLVVGAGPTGLLLAAELERRGVACLLIARSKRRRPGSGRPSSTSARSRSSRRSGSPSR